MRKHFLAIVLMMGACVFVNAQIPQDSINHSQIDTPDQGKKTQLIASDFKRVKLNDNHHCYYNIKPAIDIPIAVIGTIGTPLGYYLINKKPPTDTNVILNLDPQKDIEIGINRKDIHNYDPNLKHISDYFLYGSFAYGLVLLFDHDIRQDAGKIGLLYLETMSITGASYSLTAASVDKLRPYAYDTDSTMVNGQLIPEVPLSVRASTHARNSFYGGHPSAPAAATLFVANVYSVYHPHSAFRFALYGVAVAATGTTAYLRYKGGYHFPTDLAIGIGIGTSYGLLFTRFHRCKNGKGMTVSPMTGQIKGLDFR